MRFNLNNKNSLLFGYKGSKQAAVVTEQARFYAEACIAFCRDHDMEYYADSHTHLHSADGADAMANWLGSKGWRVTSWRLDWELADPLAWGLNFDDGCPRFIEAKISGWRYIE